jgi:hypothetical protein
VKLISPTDFYHGSATSTVPTAAGHPELFFIRQSSSHLPSFPNKGRFLIDFETTFLFALGLATVCARDLPLMQRVIQAFRYIALVAYGMSKQKAEEAEKRKTAGSAASTGTPAKASSTQASSTPSSSSRNSSQRNEGPKGVL